ncbi:MAG: hypothetical protein ACO3KD_03990 [Gaiellales bacterium]
MPLPPRIAGLRASRLPFVLLALPVLATVALLLVWSDEPEARYARASCYHEAIFASAGPVDVLVLGTSRAKYGVDPTALARDLGLDPATAGVVNLGRGGHGMGQMHQLLLDVAAQRGAPRVIAIEISPGTRRRSVAERYYRYLPSFPISAQWRQLAGDWRSKPREPAYLRLRDLLGQVQLRVDATVETALRGVPRRMDQAADAIPPRRGPQTCVPAHIDKAVQRWGRQEATLRARERRVAEEVGDATRWAERTPPAWNLDDIDLDRQDHYLRLIIGYAKTRGIPIVPVLIPDYLGGPADPAFVDAFERRYGVALQTPPLEVLAELHRDGGWYFQDANHLNRRGATVYAAWLATAIRAAGGPTGAPARP